MFTYIKTLKDLDGALTAIVNNYESEKTKWLDRLDRDPRGAMEWSGGMFQQAPRFYIAKGFLNDIQQRADALEAGEEVLAEEIALANIRDHAFRQVMTRSRRVPSSTSATSNLTDLYETAAWNDLLQLFSRPELAA